MMGAYTTLTVVSVLGVILYELLLAKTGIFRQGSYWIAMAIVGFFQILVDGWLTKLSAPIVTYNESTFSGVRVFFDSPLEDFGFGFALVTLTMVVWDQLGRRAARRDEGSVRGDTPADSSSGQSG